MTGVNMVLREADGVRWAAQCGILGWVGGGIATWHFMKVCPGLIVAFLGVMLLLHKWRQC